jgi:hypothetical protein
MTTKPNINGLAGATINMAARHPSARYRGAAEWRVICSGSSTFNPGGGLIQRHAFRLGDVLRQDRRQIQR